MQRFSFTISFCFIILISLLNWNCTKIDTTNLGADLIPAVDNVNTFADTLDIIGTQGVLDDTAKIGRADNHLLGYIGNDALFGTTKADLYLALKPNFFPYYFGNTGDSINPARWPETGFDSAFLCLAVNGFYGDSMKEQSFSAYLMDRNTTNWDEIDTTYFHNYTPSIAPTQMIGQATVKPYLLKDTVRLKNGTTTDAVNYQIRIPLSSSFLSSLTANLDTSVAGSSRNIFFNDSIFRSHYKGFAVIAEPTTGNGLFYTALTNSKTRLEVHFRRKRNGIVDTSYSSFLLASGSSASVKPSAHAFNLVRNRAGAEVSTPQPDALYIQASPGTFASLRIPGLSSLSNRVVHRAEITIDQIPSSNPADTAMAPPSFLYLDLKDTGFNAANPKGYKPIYHDLNPNTVYNPDNGISFLPSGGAANIDFAYYGGFLRKKVDQFGKTINFYTFNISRHVQGIVTRGVFNFPFRIYAPYNLNYYGFPLAYRNLLANGRIKIGNGNNANYKMRLRIVYSKI